MQWITYGPNGMFLGFFAVQGEARLSSQLASPGEIDEAAKQLKHQIDVAANRMKLELQKPPADPFG